jgi:hypothetical protein
LCCALVLDHPENRIRPSNTLAGPDHDRKLHWSSSHSQPIADQPSPNAFNTGKKERRGNRTNRPTKRPQAHHLGPVGRWKIGLTSLSNSKSVTGG